MCVYVCERGRLWITKARAMLVPASRAVSDPQNLLHKRERSPFLPLSVVFVPFISVWSRGRCEVSSNGRLAVSRALERGPRSRRGLSHNQRWQSANPREPDVTAYRRCAASATTHAPLTCKTQQMAPFILLYPITFFFTVYGSIY